MKVFSANFECTCAHASHPAVDPRKFSPRNLLFSHFHESFIPRKFPAIRYIHLLVSIMGERERTQEYGNEIYCHVYTFAKFQENATIRSYIRVQYTIDTMNIHYQHCSVGIN